MSRTALARTYRPRTFQEVEAQDHVSQTLRTAVQLGRVAHAYLFCGPRGVGKTTLARILAMALNCPQRTAEGEPCGECSSCNRIWAGQTSIDVVEFDAASNRGVDDARDLRERALYAPSDEDHYKVYIIDEAHMLTREAWNTLLKILEEPPPRVIFVFATTEPQRIQQAAPPILSRCQRFDFRRISTQDLATRLRYVLQREHIEASEEVLLPIAHRADGGMRDALSLLDQVLSFTEGSPTAADVRRILGLVGYDRYVEIFQILAERRTGDVFRFVASLMDEGYDLTEFYRGLSDFIRRLLILRLDGSESPDAGEADLTGIANAFSEGDLLRMLHQVSELDVDGRLRKSSDPRILIEILLLRFAYLERTVQLEDVLQAISEVAHDATQAPPSQAQQTPNRRQDAPTPPRNSTPTATPRPTPIPQTRGPEATRETTPPQASSPGVDPTQLQTAWIELTRGSNLPAGTFALFRSAQPTLRSDHTLDLGLPESPLLDGLLENLPLRTRILESLGTALGITLRFPEKKARETQPTTEQTSPANSVNRAKRDATRPSPQDRLQSLMEKDTLLAEAVHILDLELLPPSTST